MFHVYTGRALFINLTDNTIHEEIVPEAIYKGFIGGNVLGIRFLYERMKPGVDPLLQAPFPPNPFGDYDKKGPIYATGSAYYQLLNAVGMCAMYTTNTAPPPIAEYVTAVTGWDFGWEEGLRAGRRILTLRQAFNVREGLYPEKFELTRRILEEPLTIGPAASVPIDFEAQRNSYFTAMGWDIKSGRPSAAVLEELGLTEIICDLKG